MSHIYHECGGNNHKEIETHGYCEHGDVNTDDPLNCVYIEKKSKFMFHKLFNQKRISNFEKYLDVLELTDELFLKMYVVIAGESTENMSISHNKSFVKLDENFKRVCDIHGIEICTGKKPVKIKCGELFCSYEWNDYNKKLLSDHICGDDCKMLVLCLVPNQVYLMIRSYNDGSHHVREYEYNQLFENKLACTSETTFYSLHHSGRVCREFREYLDEKFNN